MPGDISGVTGTNVLNTQLDTGQMEVTTVVGDVIDSGAIDVDVDLGCSNKMCHQGTQTSLSMHHWTTDVGGRDPEEETKL